MTANPLHVALYCQGTFDYANPGTAEIDRMVGAAADINASGFGTVILGQWHVHQDGSIWYNQSPLDSVLEQLRIIPTALTLGGSVKRVLIDFGPGRADYDHIRANLHSFKQTMAGVIAQTGIHGFDWDLEAPGEYARYHALLVELTEWANSIGCMVTAPPYQDESFWNGVVAGMSWWNLQTYGGAWYPDWVRGFSKKLHDLNAESFIVPGYNIGGGQSPSSVYDRIEALYARHPYLDGGFIWRYEDIAKTGYKTSEYANKIIEAVRGPQPYFAMPSRVERVGV